MNDLKSRIEKQYFELYSEICTLKENMQTVGTQALPVLTDACYEMKKSEEMLHDLEREIRYAREMMEKIVGLRWTLEAVNSGGKGETIRGKLANATPDIKESIGLPKRRTPEYAEVMAWLGLTTEGMRTLFRLHWPSFCDLITDRAAKGLPIPACLKGGKKYPTYSMRYVIKKRKQETVEENPF